ncbi:MAG: GNAT family N-acetyltransferase [Planctomycetes bacterium]|nr:GNAT family N-acetyltransferase [Planctomycetota bacterium]
MRMLNVRPATPEDARIIARFNCEMARESESIELPAARIAAGVSAVLENPTRGRYWICEIDGIPAGQMMVTYEWSDWRNADFWWIQSVYTDPKYRNRGVYKSLHAHVLGAARAAGACGVRLYVEKENRRARAVYEHLGMHAAPYEMLEIDFVIHRKPE